MPDDLILVTHLHGICGCGHTRMHITTSHPFPRTFHLTCDRCGDTLTYLPPENEKRTA